jgi:hypothetical protein
MSWRFCRSLAIAVVALQLGACIISNYDISADLKLEFPIKSGTYVSNEGKVYRVRRVGYEYAVTRPKEKGTTYVRLLKIPEYSDYVFEFYEHKKNGPYNYMFLKTTEKGFDVYDIEKLPDNLPEHVAKLLDPTTDDDRRYNTVTVTNAKRDTLYVIRELSRANLKMTIPEKNSYEYKP